MSDQSAYEKYVKPYRAAGNRNHKAENATPAAKARKRRWLEANRDKNHASNKRYRETHRRQYLDTKLRNEMKRYARKWGARVVEDVDVLVLIERSDGYCELCGEEVDFDAAPRTALAQSIDHIVPLACGGYHSYENTQLAHFGCNREKGSVLP